MHIHCLQHVPFEDPAYILDWAKTNKYDLSTTHFYNSEFPPDEVPDFLIVMGGPMSIHDEEDFPWLISEKNFIKKVIEHETPVLGICLGAQLIADVLGSKVYRNPEKGIGWFLVVRTGDHPLIEKLFPEQFTPFHWHGETFEIPDGAISIGSSEACKNQGFIYNGKVVALQFHLEGTPESVARLMSHCSDELTEAPFVQDVQTMQNITSHFSSMHEIIKNLLDYLQSVSPN